MHTLLASNTFDQFKSHFLLFIHSCLFYVLVAEMLKLTEENVPITSFTDVMYP